MNPEISAKVLFLFLLYNINKNILLLFKLFFTVVLFFVSYNLG